MALTYVVLPCNNHHEFSVSDLYTTIVSPIVLTLTRLPGVLRYLPGYDHRESCSTDLDTTTRGSWGFLGIAWIRPSESCSTDHNTTTIVSPVVLTLHDYQGFLGICLDTTIVSPVVLTFTRLPGVLRYLPGYDHRESCSTDLDTTTRGSWGFLGTCLDTTIVSPVVLTFTRLPGVLRYLPGYDHRESCSTDLDTTTRGSWVLAWLRPS
ncbi:hypothetical protein J6590_009522 [Homalodisca vitripennis]|nr:hypothetical protein J6590_009522 [Homalodisca vitripennis]